VVILVPQIEISVGFDEGERPRIADLYWQAFSAKLGVLMRPETKAKAFLASVLRPDHAIAARDGNGSLLGMAGFKTAKGSFVAGVMTDLARVYGWPGALWRGPLLALLERRVEPGKLLMDGIFVEADARGRGVGSALLGAVADEAAARGLHEVRLDVIDTNPRARALYLREGFVAGKTHHLGPLRHLFGFSSSTEMRRPVGKPAECRDAAN
jgi:GNAT superfamily N-acetyltransferase